MTLKKITPENLILQYVSSFHDFPTSGVAYLCDSDERVYFICVRNDGYNVGYHLYRLTDEQWAEMDSMISDFEKYVGMHNSYENGDCMAEGPHELDSWPQFYDKWGSNHRPELGEPFAEVRGPI